MSLTLAHVGLCWRAGAAAAAGRSLAGGRLASPSWPLIGCRGWGGRRSLTGAACTGLHGGVRRGDVLLLVAVSVVGSLVGERGPGLGGDGDAGRCGHRVQAGLDGGAELDEMLAAKKGGA